MDATMERTTVRRIRRGSEWRYAAPSMVALTDVPSVPVERAWSIFTNGLRRPAFVVDCRWGRTIVDTKGKMLTCWYWGKGPGDLARTYTEQHKTL